MGSDRRWQEQQGELELSHLSLSPWSELVPDGLTTAFLRGPVDNIGRRSNTDRVLRRVQVVLPRNTGRNALQLLEELQLVRNTHLQQQPAQLPDNTGPHIPLQPRSTDHRNTDLVVECID